MKVIDKSVYAFSKDNEPVETANPGEILMFKSMDCFSNKLEREDQLMSEILYGYDVANPAAGPVYINGAEPGDVLVVDILDVKVADQGTIATDDVCGPLHDLSEP
jgi:amidase